MASVRLRVPNGRFSSAVLAYANLVQALIGPYDKHCMLDKILLLH